MKMSLMFLALLLSTLTLSGCASTKCKNKTLTDEPVAAVVAAPVKAVAAPVAEPVEEVVPAAVRKYVNK